MLKCTKKRKKHYSEVSGLNIFFKKRFTKSIDGIFCNQKFHIPIWSFLYSFPGVQISICQTFDTILLPRNDLTILIVFMSTSGFCLYLLAILNSVALPDWYIWRWSNGRYISYPSCIMKSDINGPKAVKKPCKSLTHGNFINVSWPNGNEVIAPVFELSKNKWLSHGQPSCNFWLSVHVFGCPYLEQGKWGRISQLEHENWWLSVGQHISIFGCPVTYLAVSGARTNKISNFQIHLTSTV